MIRFVGTFNSVIRLLQAFALNVINMLTAYIKIYIPCIFALDNISAQLTNQNQ